MITKIHHPSYPLSRFIQYFYYYTGYNPNHSVDRFLPDGNVQIIFDLTDYPKYIYDNNSLKEIQSCKSVWFSGFRTEPITIPSGKESEMIIVQFYKGKAFLFLNEPLHALTNYVVDAELVLKNNILDLREKLKNSVRIEQKFQILERNLLKHYLRNLQENPFVDYVISRITNKPSQVSLKEVSQKAGYSQKHIIKIFKENVGITPKEFLKVIRFQKTIQEIEEQKKINWAGIASDCGFYDQSHLIGEFKKYSGFTPEEYVRLRGDFLNYIPIR